MILANSSTNLSELMDGTRKGTLFLPVEKNAFNSTAAN